MTGRRKLPAELERELCQMEHTNIYVKKKKKKKKSAGWGWGEGGGGGGHSRINSRKRVSLAVLNVTVLRRGHGEWNGGWGEERE